MATPSAAEIGVLADGIESYRARLAGLAEPLIGTPQEDLLAALREAERAARSAHRALQIAIKIAS